MSVNPPRPILVLALHTRTSCLCPPLPIGRRPPITTPPPPPRPSPATWCPRLTRPPPPLQPFKRVPPHCSRAPPPFLFPSRANHACTPHSFLHVAAPEPGPCPPFSSPTARSCGSMPLHGDSFPLKFLRLQPCCSLLYLSFEQVFAPVTRSYRPIARFRKETTASRPSW
jgi:hypothetical protein